MNMLPSLVAILAPVISCIQLIPQLYKIYKTKSVKNISFYSLLLILITNLLWSLHGYFIADYSVLISSIISIFINTTLFNLYIIYYKKV